LSQSDCNHGRRRHHGTDAQDASGAWRAVSSRKHRFTAWPRAAAKLSARSAPSTAGRGMSSDGGLGETLKRLATGATLSADETEHAFHTIRAGHASPAQIASFLTALALRGPSVEEIASGARVLRTHMLPVSAPAGAIDVVGTGGDGQATLNVSTATS